MSIVYWQYIDFFLFICTVIPARKIKLTQLPINFFSTLNNRQIAIAIWIFIATIWAVSNSKIRKSLFHVIKAFFAWKLTISYLLMFTYITAIIMVLRTIGIWNMNHLLITMMWGIFVAFIMLFEFSKANDPEFFKKALKKNFTILIILEFIINLYVFDLWIELLIVPFSAILGGMIAISETDKKYEITKKFLNFIISLMGLLFICYAGYMVITDFKHFATIKNLESFYLPILFSITFIPFVYFSALYSGYENLFIRLGFFIDDSSVLKYAKMKMIFAFNLNLWKLNKWSKYIYSSWRFKNNQEVDEAILIFKEGASRN